MPDPEETPRRFSHLIVDGDSHAENMLPSLRARFRNAAALPEQFQGADIIDSAVPGSGRSSLASAPNVPPNSAVLISVGSNDIRDIIRNGTSPQEYAASIIQRAIEMEAAGHQVGILEIVQPDEALRNRVPAQYRDAPEIRDWVPTMRAVNQELQSQAREAGITFIPTNDMNLSHSPDHAHLTSSSYDRVAERALNMLTP